MNENVVVYYLRERMQNVIRKRCMNKLELWGKMDKNGLCNVPAFKNIMEGS